MADTPPPQKSFLFGWWPKSSKTEKRFRKIMAILLWLYVFAQLFVFDVDGYLFSHYAPSFIWVLQYKFLFVLGIASCVLVLTESRHIAAWITYITLYPLIFISKFLFIVGLLTYATKSWFVFFSVLNVFLSFFKSFKFNFVASTFAIISCVIILTSRTTEPLKFFIVGLIVLNVILIIRRFISVFKPSYLFQVHAKIVGAIIRHEQKALVPEVAIKTLSPSQMNQQQLSTWTTNLERAVLLNESCIFLAYKLREYRKSNLHVMSYLLNFLVLLLTTIVIFAFANLGLIRVDGEAFSLNSTLSDQLQL